MPKIESSLPLRTRTKFIFPQTFSRSPSRLLKEKKKHVIPTMLKDIIAKCREWAALSFYVSATRFSFVNEWNSGKQHLTFQGKPWLCFGHFDSFITSEQCTVSAPQASSLLWLVNSNHVLFFNLNLLTCQVGRRSEPKLWRHTCPTQVTIHPHC